jgi:hypothetical protein
VQRRQLAEDLDQVDVARQLRQHRVTDPRASRSAANSTPSASLGAYADLLYSPAEEASNRSWTRSTTPWELGIELIDDECVPPGSVHPAVRLAGHLR